MCRCQGHLHIIAETLGPSPFLSGPILPSQYVLLLAMFIKPMLVPQGSTQSGGAIYRRVVNRNILCTVCIVFSYIVTTLVVVLAYARSSPKVRSTLPTNTVTQFYLPAQRISADPESVFDEDEGRTYKLQPLALAAVA